MNDLPDESIDLTVTSPPYDNLRDYNGNIDQWSFDKFKKIAQQLYRVTKRGGVVVWVVGDQTKNSCESGTSFRQALYFMECGFKLFDTMIYEKNSSTFPARKNSKRYTQIFEYMFIFSKGVPKIANLICDKVNKWAGHKDFSGKLKNPVPEKSPRTNIWRFTTSFNNKTGHPAVFPLNLAEDHIITWSKTKDVVFDPFMGSGTTAIAAINTNRKFIGFEIDKEYFNAAKNRIKETLSDRRNK